MLAGLHCRSLKVIPHKGRNLLAYLMPALILCLILPSSAFAWLSSPPTVPTGQSNVLLPDISVDSTGAVHAIWMYSDENDFSKGQVYYIRGALNANGDAVTWEQPQQIGPVRTRNVRPPRIFADQNGTVHVTYGGVDGRVYYLRNPNRGAAGSWATETVAVPPGQFYGIGIAADGNSVPYIAWGEGLGDNTASVVFTYRTGTNAWKSRVSVSPKVFLTRKVSLTVVGTGSTASVHLIYEYKEVESSCAACLGVGYSRGTRDGSFRSSNFGASFGYDPTTDPSITSDLATGRLYAGFISGSVGSGYKLRFTSSTNNGQSWNSPASLTAGSDLWPGASSLFAINNTVHIATEQKRWSGSAITANWAYYQGFNSTSNSYTSSVRISSNETSREPRISAGGPGKVAIWTVNNTAALKYNVDPGGGGGSVGPSATPQLPANTKDTAVSVSFASVQGSPTEVRWRWGAAPTDTAHDSTGANGWVTFTNPLSVPLPSNASACQSLTLYTQVKAGTVLEGAAKSATVLFDNTVQANVRIVNPFLAGLPQTFTTVQDTSMQPSDGAYDGDPSYTRIPQFFLGVYNAGDCSNLSSFSVPASNTTGSISNGRYENKVALPQAAITNPGIAQTIGVSVVDGIGNLGNYSTDLIYDPADTDPSTTVTNTAGLPVLNAGSGSVDNAASIIRTLSFSGVSVDDNVYGNKENLPAGRQFWGVWVANALSDVGAGSPNLQWYPVRVSAPNSTFSVKWNIFTGLNLGPDRNKAGTYFVYVRFLDGAGNASLATNAIKIQVPLAAGYTIPTLDLPFIVR